MKRVAVVATIYRYLSHAQHFIDRLFAGYPYGGEWIRPDVELVSLYVDQRPVGDQSVDRAREFGFQIYPTIAEALRCGGDELAVDGVLVIGEHGEYPKNEFGQTLYPRYEFFSAVTEVFRRSGRSVPVFSDKHLSTDWDRALEMVETSRELRPCRERGQPAGGSNPGGSRGCRGAPAGAATAAGGGAAPPQHTASATLS